MTVIGRLVAIGLAFLIAHYGASCCSRDSLQERLNRAKKEVAEGRLPPASRTLRDILAATKDPDIKADAQFTLALAASAELDLARQRGIAAEIERARESSLSEWQRYLALRPESLVGKNNVAITYADGGNLTAAAASLVAVVEKAEGDVDQVFFRRNLGDVYVQSGDWSRAADQYVAVLQDVPAERTVVSHLVDVYTSPGAKGVDAMFSRVAKDIPLSRLYVAEEVLRRKELSTNRETATVELAAALADYVALRGVHSAQNELESAATEMAPQARSEISRVLNADTNGPFVWWTAGDAPRQRAFARLAQGVATQAWANDSTDNAMNLLREAASIARGDDPAAVTPLIEVYVGRSESIADLDPILDDFMNKASTPLPVSEDVYQFHLAAGVAYANANRWNDSKVPRHGALYHLERATEIGKVLKKNEPGLDSYLADALKAPSGPSEPREPSAPVPPPSGPVPPPNEPPVDVASKEPLDGGPEKSEKPPCVKVPHECARIDDAVVSEARPGTVIGKMLFAFDSDVPCCEALDDLIAQLKADPSLKIIVEGYTDSTGPAEYNLDLASRRANAVIDCLKAAGIDGSRMRPESYGEGRRAMSNETRAGRQCNRRVECVVER